MAAVKKLAAKKQRAAPFGNRIVGHGTLPAGQFLANPDNWRQHPRAQRDAIDGVLREVGFVQSVIVNKRTAAGWGKQRGVETMVDGHLRVEQALNRGEDTPVPVVYVDLTPAEERRVLLLLDPIGALAGRDDEPLDALLAASAEDFPESDVDLAAILKRETRKVSFDAGTATNVLVQCADVESQDALMARLKADGFTCKATTRR